MITDNVADLEVGDSVIIHTRFDRVLAQVERKTKASLFVNGERFNFRGKKVNNRDDYYLAYIYPATEKEMISYEKHTFAKARKALIAKLRDVCVSDALSNDELKDIIEKLQGTSL